jgi:hypothetical protein
VVLPLDSMREMLLAQELVSTPALLAPADMRPAAAAGEAGGARKAGRKYRNKQC